jgi:hypothetical protein
MMRTCHPKPGRLCRLQPPYRRLRQRYRLRRLHLRRRQSCRLRQPRRSAATIAPVTEGYVGRVAPAIRARAGFHVSESGAFFCVEYTCTMRA